VPFGSRGNRGVCEPVSMAAAAAVGNAFFDATGVRLRTAPLTPARVRAALKAAGAASNERQGWARHAGSPSPTSPAPPPEVQALEPSLERFQDTRPAYCPTTTYKSGGRRPGLPSGPESSFPGAARDE
jgi:hypothetical protein